jgi:hypothetical protein
MLVYAATIILSAFLLFLVQPLITKIILPWFGGSAAVWSAALMFFQTSVLVGYGYAYWLTRRVQPRNQFFVHAALLLASCALLPILPSPDLRPLDGSDPTLRILTLLSITIGLPCFLLSSTSPLLQVWYVRRTGSDMPYQLFALSNLGSVLALLSFPLIIEPRLDSRVQVYTWSGLFVVFVALCAYAAWLSRGHPLPDRDGSAATSDSPTVASKALWVTLSATASAMLIAVTTHLTADVAPIPLLWVVPLALYLLTFVLTFGSNRFYGRKGLLPWLVSVLAWMAYSITAVTLNIQYAIPLYLVGLFLCCMACHGELAQRRPAPAYLASFYVWIAFGGALGGAFVVIIAPSLFDTFLELPVLLLAVAVLSLAPLWRSAGTRADIWLQRGALIAGIGLFALYLGRNEIASREADLRTVRNFYGVLRVRDKDVGTALATRILIHGTIQHGSESLAGDRNRLPGSYYAPNSGVGAAILALQAQGAIRYGVIGLGAGVMAGYARQGDYLRIYEINPATRPIAEQMFTFLSHAKAVGADTEVLMGDARLTLEKQPRQQYDLLVVDAFSSDAIPVHLLTQEAFRVYFEHLKADGVLAVHVSNQYLDLVPVCARAAELLDRPAVVIDSAEDRELFAKPSNWVLVTSNRTLYQRTQFTGMVMRPAKVDSAFTTWTDQYSSLWPLVKL